MTPRAASLFAALWLAGGAIAQDAADLAREASRQLSEATEMLSEADSASNRIAALTRTVRAYETGLSAMRDGLRRASLDERQLRGRLEAEDARLAELLAVLVTVERTSPTVSLLHPDGPLKSVRAGMIVADVAPALQAEATALVADLEALSTLVTLREAGVQTLEDGLEGIRAARLQLSQAMSERTDLPPALATDDAAIAALINSTESLAAFADSLAGDRNGDLPRSDMPWSRPVAGQVLRKFNEADAAGVRRPGWIIAAQPLAVVTAPVPATVRFAGELPGQGQVVILEHAASQLLILSGIGQTYAVRGQIVSGGEAIGLMGGETPSTQENLIETSDLGGQPRSETLYMEVRQDQKPVDPAIFFVPGDQ